MLNLPLFAQDPRVLPAGMRLAKGLPQSMVEPVFKPIVARRQRESLGG
jgi:hypothetical protein